MNLYLISQEVNRNKDAYDSAIVCAENEDEARQINPTGKWGGDFAKDQWAESPAQVNVKFIGYADKSIVKGVVQTVKTLPAISR